MLFTSRLSLPDQAQTLVTSLAEQNHRLDSAHAQRLCVGLTDRAEKSAAKWLRKELAEQGIEVKHSHALRLVGQIAGRDGWHRADASNRDSYTLMSVGLNASAGWETTSHDSRVLLERLCNALRGWVDRVDGPRVVTVRRAAQELMLQCNAVEPDGFMALLKTVAPVDWQRWIKFQDYAVERFRRLFVEGKAPVFLDGLTLAAMPSAEAAGVRELALFEGGIELGRGSDLHVLEILEAEAKGDLAIARADLNHVRVGGQSFALMEMYRKLEPLLEMSERTLLHPETEQLLRQYQVFRRKVGKSLVALKLGGRYTVPDGLPQEIPVNWDAVAKAMSEQDLVPAELVRRGNSTEMADVLGRRPLSVSVTSFVQLAIVLECKDFNSLVRKPTWGMAVPADEASLRSVLYAADEVRFVLSRDLAAEHYGRMREAAEDLSASRKVREMNMTGVIREPLDEMVFAHDGDDFLAAAEDCDAEVRLQVVPAFVTAESLGLPAQENQLPGIGRRLTLLVRPRATAEERQGRAVPSPREHF